MGLTLFMNNIGDTLETGDVVVIDEKKPTKSEETDAAPLPEVDLTDRCYDHRVCGIVSHVSVELKPSALSEMTADSKEKQSTNVKAAKEREKGKDTRHVVCTIEELDDLDRTKIDSGKIGLMVTHGPITQCKVDADVASIKAGDLLTTSPTKGHAQKVIDSSKAVGAIVGKALGNLKKGKGQIPVLVTLQ